MSAATITPPSPVLTRGLLPLLLELCVLLLPVPGQAYKFVDLSHPQNPSTIYWPGVPGFNRTVVAASTNPNGVWIEVGAFTSGEHGGTHIDAPRHFFPSGYDLKDLPLERTVAEGVVIDCSVEGGRDYDFALTVKKLQDWEEKHGRIPNEAAVLVYFGYAPKFSQPELYFNTDQLDDPSTYHFPYVSMAAAQWLLDNRNIKMVGFDVPSPDAATDSTYPVHVAYLSRNIVIMENVNIPTTLPPRNFRLHAAPIRIEGGTGVQTRIYAMLYDRVDGGATGLRSFSSVSLFVCLTAAIALARFFTGLRA